MKIVPEHPTTCLRKPALPGFLAVVTLAYGLSSAATAAGGPDSAVAGIAAPVESLTATVCAVDAGAGTLDLITGVGHALRIRRVHPPPQLRATSGRSEVAAATLPCGSIVCVVCRRTPGGTVASSIGVLRAPAERKP
jgi:hypothetical protein